MRSLNSGGFSLPEVLLSLGALSFAAILSLTLADTQRQSHANNITNGALSTLRDSMLATIANQESWEQTKARNQAMACSLKYPSTCSSTLGPQEINLYTSKGSLLFNRDALASNSGFTANGTACSNYSAQGNSNCPLRARTYWQVSCQGLQNCKYPEEIVSVLFEYSPSPGDKKVINVNRYSIKSFSRTNFGENDSPVIACARKGDFIFIGFGQSVQNGDGISTSADPDGCVNRVAFKGKTGVQGPQGPQGPTGPSGGAGSVSINNLASNSDPSGQGEKLCAGMPDICLLYRKYFDRYPDIAGAEYWNSVKMMNGGDLAAIDKEFAWRADGNLKVYIPAPGQPALSNDTWNSVASKYGLDISDGECAGSSSCTAASAQAAEEWAKKVNDFCSTPGNTCKTIHVDDPG